MFLYVRRSSIFCKIFSFARCVEHFYFIREMFRVSFLVVIFGVIYDFIFVAKLFVSHRNFTTKHDLVIICYQIFSIAPLRKENMRWKFHGKLILIGNDFHFLFV